MIKTSFYFEFDKDKLEKENIKEEELHKELDIIFNQLNAKKTAPGEYYTEESFGDSFTVFITIKDLPELCNTLSKYDVEIIYGDKTEYGSYLDAIVPK